MAYRDQHFIPRGYLKQWCNDGKNLFIIEKNNLSTIEQKNKENVMFIPNKYTIYAGMLCADNDDLLFLFDSFKDLVVEYEGKVLNFPDDLNKYYWDIDNWIITDKNGKRRSNKKLKNATSQLRSLRIETGWNTAENQWPVIYKNIVQILSSKRCSTISAFNRKEILEFIISLLFRGSNNFIDNIIKEMKERLFSDGNLDEMESTLDEYEFWESQELAMLSKYQKSIGGIKKVQDELIDKLQGCFLVGRGSAKFITSDSPCYIYLSDNEERFNGIYCPISPDIAFFGCRNNETNPTSKYKIIDLNNDEIKKINTFTIETASKEIVSSIDDFSRIV